MASIKVKNLAGTTVTYDNVDTVVLPTSDGGTQMFRKWNGVEAVKVACKVDCYNSNEIVIKAGAQNVNVSASVSLS